VSVLNYPANAIYQFEGFNGIADKAKLTSFIISTAQQDGTSLMTLTSQKQTSSKRLYNIIFSCIHHRKNTNVSKMCFKDDQLQATGTIRGREHQIKSVKGSSRCSKNSFANTTKDSISKNGIVKKMNRIRPTSSDKQCLFKLTVFLSQQDNKWYVSKFSDRMKSSLSHTNHNQLSGDDLCTHLKTIDDHVRKKVADLFDTGASNNAIANIINMEYDIGINVCQIKNFKDDRINEIMNDFEKNQKSSVDKLLALFDTMTDVSYVYMMHSNTSGFVTYHKSRNECNTERIELSKMSENDKKAFLSLSPEEKRGLETWRNKLKIGDSDDILVSFAWTHDHEKRMMLMFPEVWAVDMTFGLNLERRQLVTICGVDGNCNSFTGLRVWMPSTHRVV
jgi:hypothetical protein